MWGRSPRGERKTAPMVMSVWDEAADRFGFLVDRWLFEKPERTAAGLSWHRPGLHVHFGVWQHNNESGVSTDLEDTFGSVQLSCLFVACELGPPQRVPEGSGSRKVISKRIGQHADALGLVMPLVSDAATAGALFERCRRGVDSPR